MGFIPGINYLAIATGTASTLIAPVRVAAKTAGAAGAIKLLITAFTGGAGGSEIDSTHDTNIVTSDAVDLAGMNSTTDSL
jgi:hypothetical protein